MTAVDALLTDHTNAWTGGPLCIVHGTPLNTLYLQNGTRISYCPLCPNLPPVFQGAALAAREPKENHADR